MSSDEPYIREQLTQFDLCQILSERSGKTVTPETHWIRVAFEITREHPPYALIQLEAHKR